MLYPWLNSCTIKLRRKTIFYRWRCNCCVYSSIGLACVYSYYGTSCSTAPVNGLHNILFSSTEFASSLVCVPNVSANREDRIQSRTHSFSVIRVRKHGEEKLIEENNYATRYTCASNYQSIVQTQLRRINFGERRNRGTQNSDPGRVPSRQGNPWFSVEDLRCFATQTIGLAYVTTRGCLLIFS